MKGKVKGQAAGGLVAGLTAGVLLGTAVGMLLAPNPGKETRKVVRDKTRDYVSTLQQKYRKQRVSDAVSAESNGHGETLN